VSLPGFGRVWRKLELPADSTLEHLHLAIQSAYDFDNDHLYSFFMSGKAWDDSTEYSLPEDAYSSASILLPGDEDDEDEDWADEEDEAEGESEDEEGDMALPEPTQEQLVDMLNALKSDPKLRAEAKKQVTEQLGIPGFLFDMIVNNADQLIGTMDDPDLVGGAGFNMFPFGPKSKGDVRTTTLESLNLRKGKTFLYLFDYGDEWRFKVKVSAVNPKADPNAVYPLLVESVGEAPPQYPDWDDEEEEEGETDEADDAL
jgi:hypothetical protein